MILEYLANGREMVASGKSSSISGGTRKRDRLTGF
jgi:hypothetical protein